MQDCAVHTSAIRSSLYFSDPEDMEFKETTKNERKKLGNTNGPRYALQDKQEKQEKQER